MYIFGTCRFIQVLWIKRSWDGWGSSKSRLSNYQCLNKFIHLSPQHKMKSDSLQYMYIIGHHNIKSYLTLNSGLLLFVVYHINDKCSNQCFSQEINVLSYKKWCTKYTFWFLFMKTIIFKTCLFRILIRLNTKKRLNLVPKSVEKQWMKSLVPDSAFNPPIAISEMQGVLRPYSNTDASQL